MGVAQAGDSYFLTGPNGSGMEVASFVIEPGPDFGEADLQKAIYSENPMMEGGVLAAEYVNVRRMAFPLRVASISSFGGAAGVQAWLRTLARPGATLDLTPDGSTDPAVRFDVNAGRFEPNSSWDRQQWKQTDRMEGTLKLDVQPLGYWPTLILLASSASVGLPGSLPIPNSSVIGDVPALVSLMIVPTNPTHYAAGSWLTDTVAWSFAAPAGAASFFTYWGAGSVTRFSGITGTLAADKYAVSSQAQQLVASQTQTNWDPMVAARLINNTGAGLPMANNGRFRLFAYMRLGPSQSQPWQIAADTVLGAAESLAPLGSAGPVATLVPEVASAGGSVGAFGPQPSPAYQLLDLGDIDVPPVGSQTANAPELTSLRLWSKPATSNVGVATPILSFGGFYLLPLNGAAGVLPRGLAVPTIHPFASPTQTGYLIDSTLGQQWNFAVGNFSVSSQPQPVLDTTAQYRGVQPHLAASNAQLDLLGAGRMVATGAASTVPARNAPTFAKVSIAYRPRFLFMKGL